MKKFIFRFPSERQQQNASRLRRGEKKGERKQVNFFRVRSSAPELKLFILIVFLIAVFVIYSSRFKEDKISEFSSPVVVRPQEISKIKTAPKEIIKEGVVTPEETLPKKIPPAASQILLDVPFTSQAPEADWSYPWQDACEEAVILMAAAYFEDLDLNSEFVKAELLRLIEYQNEVFGFYHDTDIIETAKIGREVYGLNIEIKDNPTIQEMKNSLLKGHLIIAPMAGRLLNNPHFTPPGPQYHMLLVIGYNDDMGEFIVNDPGTRYGSQFRYSYNNLMTALHDWTGSDYIITEGLKRIMIIKGILV